MTAIPVTLLFGSLTALLQGLLGIGVSASRGKTGMHDTPSPDLFRKIRAHANCAEWAPILLFMLLLLELSGAPHGFLMGLGTLIFVARLCHGVGVYTKSKLSLIGASLTYLACLVGPIAGLYFRLHG